MSSPAAVLFGQSDQAAARCSERAIRTPATVSPPLDRMIVVYAHDVSLRDALDRVGAAAGIRLSYSNDFVPLDRRVCLPATRISAAQALATLLDSVDVDPVVVSADQIALEPSAAKPPATPASFASGVGMLERVVVTGSALGEAQRPLTIALDVVSAAQARSTDGSLSQLFGAGLPGVWVSPQSPSALLARYGSIRGASSFGLSYPKIYIDGVEVANPLLITELDPAILDRVEVIRGPQGAALYGADAISGVVNIVTRHAGTSESGSPLEITSTEGLSQSTFASHPVPQQQQGAVLSVGSNLRSANLSFSGSTIGAFTPNASSSELHGGGALRIVSARTTLSAMARVYAKTADIGPNPLLTAATPAAPIDAFGHPPTFGDTAHQRMASVFARPVADSSPESVREYTVGVTGALLQSDRWTHTLSAGVDGYQLSNLPNDFTPVPSSADSALRAARGSAARGTLRASSVGQFNSNAATFKLTIAAEQSTLRESAEADQSGPGEPQPGRNVSSLINDFGLVTQVDAGFRNMLFLTGGLRGERTAGAGSVTTSALPMLGAAWVQDVGAATLKLRSAYGRAIRPPQSAARQTTWLGVHTSGTSSTSTLQPEEQSGIEAGADLLAGNHFGLHLTRFDQRASGLIQPVAVVGDTGSVQFGPPVNHLAYTLQNVGEIDNDGWEMESSLAFDRLSLNGSLSLVDSRVHRVASGYDGDLRPGDRMLGVPRRTASMSAAWTASAWWTTITMSRAADWINYDRVALALAAANPDQHAQDLVGATLRNYWLRYHGVTRLDAAAAHDLFRRLALTVRASNLLNEQVGDPDNVTVVPGRAFLVGARARF